MFRVTWRSLMAKRLRLLATALAIVLGVAFTVSTLVLTTTMSRSIESAIDGVSDGVDVLVRGEATVSTGSSVVHGLLPASALSEVERIDGVRAAAPYLEGSALLLTPAGKVLDVPQSVGLGWIRDPDLSVFELSEGEDPQRGEVVLGRLAADKAGLAVGDSVDVVTTGAPEPFRVIGIADMRTGSNVGAVAFVLFDPADAAGRIVPVGKVNAVLAAADDGVDPETLSATVAATLDGTEVITGTQMATEQKASADDALAMMQRIMLVFAGIALFVGCFTIANTFSITLAQRTRELALLRALGGSRRQLVASVVLESALLGLVASLVGLVAGIGVARGLLAVLGQAGLSVPEGPLVVTGSVVVVALVAGVGVTVLSAFLPARRAARVAPVTAMRDSAIEPDRPSSRRALLGLVLGTVSAALVIGGLQRSEPSWAGAGAALGLAAALVLGPVLVRPVVAALGWPLRLRGVPGRMATANASRNPRRSAATAAALMIGVALVSGSSLVASTAKQSISGQVERTLVADLVVRPLGSAPGVPAELTAALQGQDGLAAVPMRTTVADVDGETAYVTGVDLGTGLVDVELVDGALPESDEEVLVSRSTAEARGWSVGDALPFTLPSGAEAAPRITGVFEDTNALAAVVSTYTVIASASESPFDDVVLISGDESALAAASGLVDSSPLATVETVAEFTAQAVGVLDALLALVLGFLGLAVVIAVLGIATTIGLSVHERTREIGMLRTVGMARRQVRSSIRWESIVISGYGAAVGLVVGLGATWALLGSLDGGPLGTPAWQAGPLLAVAVGAVLAGTLAAAAPARRASRLAVLDAVRAD